MRTIKIFNKRKLRRICIIVIIVLLTAYVKSSFDKATSEYADTEASNVLTKAVNEAVIAVLKEKSLKYSDLANIVSDGAGKVRSIEVDTLSLNIVKSELTVAVMNMLDEIESRSFGVHIGNIIGSRLFSGRGTKVKIKIVPLGTIASETVNKFVSAGINQTNHRIELLIKASATVVSPFSDASLEISTSVCLAETVIVGDIPDTYLHFTRP